MKKRNIIGIIAIVWMLHQLGVALNAPIAKEETEEYIPTFRIISEERHY